MEQTHHKQNKYADRKTKQTKQIQLKYQHIQHLNVQTLV